MHARNFDKLARTLAAPSTRRGLLAFAAGFAGLSARNARAVQLSNGTCGVAGEVCTILIGCCEGLTCATSTINTNYGVCVTGGDGGTMAVTDSIIAPTSDQSSTQMNALAQEIAASASTSTTTDPNADQQARRDARQSKRSSRRSTRKSTNNTQQTNRKSRRDTRQLNASPQLSLESFTGQGDGESGVATEIVRVNNLDNETIVLSRVSSITDPALVSTVSVTIAAGSSYLLESGVFQQDPDDPDDIDEPNSAIGTIWTEDSVCDGSANAGYTVTAAKSGATSTYTFDVLCDQIATFVNPGSGQHNHRQQNQQQQRRRRRRAQRKHNRADHRGK